MQVLVNGLIVGLMISVLALAFAVAYLPTRTFHLALGGVHTVAPYIVSVFVSRQLGWPLGVAVACIVAIVISSLCELLNHRRLQKIGAPPAVELISSLGLYIAITQCVVMIWGNDEQTLRTNADTSFQLAGIVLRHLATIR